MMTFSEFLLLKGWYLDEEMTLRSVSYKPNAQIPTKTFRTFGPEKMNPLGVVTPYKPKTVSSIFRKKS
jgi:hypothetical protein